MEIVTVKWVDVEPAEYIPDYPDFLICQLIETGIGKIESHIDPADKGHLQYRLTSRRTGEQKVICTCPIHRLRPMLARFGFKVGISPYAGHIHFGIQFEGEADQRPEFFSLYLSNEPETEYWLKLYLHHIEGVWPIWGLANPKADADAA